MADEQTGQSAESRPAGEENQEGLNTGQEGAGTQDGAKGDEGAAGKEGGVEGKDYVVIDGKKFYSSFDTHPEWRELKDARDGFQDLLESNGYKDKAELLADLESGVQLKDVIGDRNADELIEAANKWQAAEEYWAEQEARKLEEGESPEQTAERLRRENKELKDAQTTERERQEEIRESREALNAFNKEVDAAIGEAKIEGDTAKIAKLFLGVDNPMDDVDVRDQRAMRVAIGNGMKQFNSFVQSVKQAAVDEYVKGKSDIVPIAKHAGTETSVPTGDKFQVQEGESPEAAMGRANQRLVDLLNAANKE